MYVLKFRKPFYIQFLLRHCINSVRIQEVKTHQCIKYSSQLNVDTFFIYLS